MNNRKKKTTFSSIFLKTYWFVDVFLDRTLKIKDTLLLLSEELLFIK